MIAMFKGWAHRYPEQAFLLIFNSGVFVWLRLAGSAISNKLALGWDHAVHLPNWLINLSHNSLAGLQDFFGHTALTWLIVSMVLTLVLRFIKGLVKLLLFLLIVGVGVYLVYRHQTILGQIPG
ncbi:hypothetical protein [Streptococcus sobrinus]|uniref:hypothetical protein n=1 Tax=Streptococcus sobrinus TaxID=1310 RepID=UPI0002D4275B|nr:hypothetical protein [Streptococcus sobrinus]